MKTLRHYFPALVAVALLGRPAFAADPPPDVTLPPSEQPKAFVAFAKSQADDTVDWTLKDANVPAAWAKGVTGKGFVVGVIDTGTDTRHPDLAGQEIGGTDFSGKGSTLDGNGHGTWCASHIVGKKDGKGIVGGAYNAKLRTYKALSDQGSGYNSAIARAIDQAAADGCHVISLSLGSPQPDPLTLAALKRAIDRGCIIACIAAGNEGPREGTVGYPGGFAAGELPLVVCVAAHDRGGATAAFSSRGKAVTITLGGVDALAAWLGGQYAAIDGTSMATPLAAVLALLWLEGGGGDLPAKDRPAAFLAALVRSCDQYPKRDTARGYGKPDAVKLLAAIPKPPVPPQPGERTITLDTPELRAGGIKRLVVVLDGATTPIAPAPVPLPPATEIRDPVPGVWVPPAPPWHVPSPPTVPQTMPATCPPGGCKADPQPLILPGFQPFGGKFRPSR